MQFAEKLRKRWARCTCWLRPGPLRNSSIADLSDRELEVFRLIGEAHGTRQIAEDLHVSVKTVESYQAHIKEKLSLRSARGLMQHAMQRNMNETVG